MKKPKVKIKKEWDLRCEMCRRPIPKSFNHDFTLCTECDEEVIDAANDYIYNNEYNYRKGR